MKLFLYATTFIFSISSIFANSDDESTPSGVTFTDNGKVIFEDEEYYETDSLDFDSDEEDKNDYLEFLSPVKSISEFEKTNAGNGYTTFYHGEGIDSVFLNGINKVLYPENTGYRTHTSNVDIQSDKIIGTKDTFPEVRKDILSVSIFNYTDAFMDSAYYVYRTGGGGFYEEQKSIFGNKNSLKTVVKNILENKEFTPEDLEEKITEILELYNSYKKQNIEELFGRMVGIAVKDEILDQVAYIAGSFGRVFLKKDIKEYVDILRTEPRTIGNFYSKKVKTCVTVEEMTHELLEAPQARLIISHELLQQDNNMIIKEVRIKKFHQTSAKQVEDELRKILIG